MNPSTHETDVLVVGSGAGALTAAITAHDQGSEVLVIEKTGLIGGTSAMSGGVLWLPNSPLIAGAGAQDSREEARDYMRAVIDTPELEDHIDAFIDTIPAMVDYLHKRTPLRLDVLAQFPDMYPGTPGFKMHRCHEARAFHGRALGNDLKLLREQHPQTRLYNLIGWTASESLVLQARGPGWLWVGAKMVLRYLLDIPARLAGTRDRRQVLGGALVASLLLALRERQVPLWLNSAAEELVEEDGRVVGVVVQSGGERLTLRARRGVILASGGFEKNEEMREQHLGEPTRAAWTAGSPGNTGEMIRVAEAHGADTGFMNEAWWGPTITMPGESQARMLIIEKNLPGSILVDKRGQRFVNESSSYTKVIRGMQQAHRETQSAIPAHLIFDASYRQRYPMGPLLPSPFQPDWMVPKVVWQEIKRADSIAELAGMLEVDAEALEATVQRFNEFAREGRDLDFQRGDAEYDRYYGDHEVQPNPCLGPIIKPPFYGVRVYPGDLGTKGGVKTNPRAQAVRADGTPIPGLYAIGNTSASVMGGTYPASGATLAPAMVFGYIAGLQLGGTDAA